MHNWIHCERDEAISAGYIAYMCVFSKATHHIHISILSIIKKLKAQTFQFSLCFPPNTALSSSPHIDYSTPNIRTQHKVLFYFWFDNLFKNPNEKSNYLHERAAGTVTETRKFSRNIRRRWVLSYFFSFILSFFFVFVSLLFGTLCGTQEEWTAVWWLYFKCDLSAPIAASSQLFLLSFNLLLSFSHHHLAGLVYKYSSLRLIHSVGWMDGRKSNGATRSSWEGEWEHTAEQKYPLSEARKYKYLRC